MATTTIELTKLLQRLRVPGWNGKGHYGAGCSWDLGCTEICKDVHRALGTPPAHPPGAAGR